MKHDLTEMLLLDRKDLLSQWQTLFGRDPPPHTHASFLRLALAWQVQAGAQGVRGSVLPTSPVIASSMTKSALRPGTRLVREWQGRTYHVLVTESGFDYDGKIYRSLSAIARAITGTQWSGPAFFGIGR